MRNADFGTGNGEIADGTCRMADGKWQMANGRWRMADDRCEVSPGGCAGGESGEPTPEVSQDRIVGHDSNRVIDDSTNDKIGILSQEGTDAADRPCQGACDRQSLPSGAKTLQEAPKEAQLESTQGALPLNVKPSAPACESATKPQQEGSGEWRKKSGQ